MKNESKSQRSLGLGVDTVKLNRLFVTLCVNLIKDYKGSLDKTCVVSCFSLFSLLLTKQIKVVTQVIMSCLKTCITSRAWLQQTEINAYSP